VIDEILAYLRNYFVVGDNPGTYTIENGTITLPFLISGQYFQIIGSVLNDGVYKYPVAASTLKDETFTGTVRALAVPPSVIALAAEIETFVTKDKPSPYTSESFGGYSYSRAKNASGNNADWQDVFGGRLRKWRKM